MGEAVLFPGQQEARFTVYGIPAPKGSTRSFAVRSGGAVTGRTVTVPTNREQLRDWTRQVSDAIARQVGLQPGLIRGPVYVALMFWLPRPKSHPKTRRTWPAVAPDIDKLARAVLDPMSEALIEDDSRVVGLLVEKDYAVESGDDRPRAEVQVWAIDDRGAEEGHR